VDDDSGDAVFHDPSMTGIEAYRAGIRTLRAAAAPGTYIAACNVRAELSFDGRAIGLVDAMRIGPDTGRTGSDPAQLPSGTRHVLPILHNRVWHNDPDCTDGARARSPLTQARSFRPRGSRLSGSLNLVSEMAARIAA